MLLIVIGYSIEQTRKYVAQANNKNNTAAMSNDSAGSQETLDQFNIGSDEENNNQEGEKQEMSYKFPGILPDERIQNKKVVLETAKGTIEIELEAKDAPKTVSNFVYLATSGLYDGLTFHRVEPGFVIQGGDPRGNGTGGPGYQFPDEPVAGDYKKGSVAMANSGPDTNGSQFFICLDDLPTLPKQYNLFGRVVKGMDIISKIVVGDEIEKATVSDL
jgi:cyclophilin family peptidyl-prolyl cis-trans isomerase